MIQFTVQAAPLPSDFLGTPQELFDAFLDRLEITTDALTFVVQDTAPTEDMGPWFKDGKQIWVWDTEESEYVPLDISASYTPQIWVGEEAPEDNGDTYSMWFKLDGSTVVGLYYYMGTEAGWVKEEDELTEGSVTTAMLANASVTTAKLANLSVTSAKLANDLPLSKWERGSAYEFARMSSDAGEAEWAPFLIASAEKAIATGVWTEVTHSLGRVPNFLQVVLVCKTAEFGWVAGDELRYQTEFPDTGSGASAGTEYRTATQVGVVVQVTPSVRSKGDATVINVITPGNWKLKFYYGVG